MKNLKVDWGKLQQWPSGYVRNSVEVLHSGDFWYLFFQLGGKQMYAPFAPPLPFKSADMPYWQNPLGKLVCKEDAQILLDLQAAAKVQYEET